MTQSAYVQRGAALLAFTLCLCVPLAAHAQASDTGALREEVKDLKQVIQRLNARLEGLEKRLAPGAAATAQPVAASETPSALPSASATPTPSLREHWRQIDHGMSAQDVQALLGAPQRTMKVSVKTVWYYTYPEIGSGSVVFADDGSVEDWQTPPFNMWW
jgi:hypothetical protein